MLSVDRASQRERAAVAAFQLLPRALQADLRTATRDRVVPLVVREASRQADTPTMRAIVASARYAPYKGVPAIAFGGTKRVTASGVPGRVLVRGLEYGSKGRWTQNVRTTSRSGKAYTARRRTTRQFLPDRSGRPTAIYPTMQAVQDDVLAVWVDLVETAAIDAFNGEG